MPNHNHLPVILVSKSIDTCVFQLPNGVRFQVSPDDMMFVVNSNWSMTGDYVWNKHGYLHKAIAIRMGLKIEHEVDHENTDKLDNRRHNLRPATHSQNQMNIPYRGNIAGLKGVSFVHSTGRWKSRIKKEGREISLGCFDTPELAHAAYCEAVRNLHGEFGRTA